MRFTKQAVSLAALALLVGACGAESGVSDTAQSQDEPTSSVPETTVGETTSTTEAPTTTSQPEEPNHLGTLDDPLPVGAVADIGDWRLRVTGVTPEATDEVLDRKSTRLNSSHVRI